MVPHLYEMVQYVSGIVPRLYVMITVGAFYIEIKHVDRLNILSVLDMCLGVQHPVRIESVSTPLSLTRLSRTCCQM